MKKIFLLSLFTILLTFSSYSQTSKWGVSVTHEFTKIEASAFGITEKEDLGVTNLNVHYSILSWASDFQIGPLVAMRFYSLDGESGSDFQLGLNLGYNFSKSFAIVMDTYKVFDDIDDHSIFVFKPALEITSKKGSLAGQIGYAKYSYGGSYSKQFDTLKAGGLLVGLKYKF
jgi:hypothetical protein